ncbi:MAG: fibronectin type III domain-containing protein, partial [Sphingobacteriia bacterium]|nr:fibronectin type III domain-containing protein [Sphingobacteriia bacterium]
MLNWTPGGEETIWNILWGETGFDPENAGILIEEVMQNSYFLEGLSPATSYDFYVRAVCDVGYYSAWAVPGFFTTGEEPVVTIPTVFTAIVEQITQTSAVSGGNIIYNGGATIISSGVVWSTTENPTVEINEGMTSDGTGSGSWMSELTELTQATSYFVRAYATNTEGTGYGEQLAFETLSGTPPNWIVNPFFQYNMQIIGQLQYEDGGISLNGNDIVAAFVGEECRGVMSPDPGFMGIIFLTVGSNQQTGEIVTFKAYLNDSGEIVDLNQTLVFENQLQTGSISQPYIFGFYPTGPPNWEPNPFLQYNMQIIGQLQYEDGEISMNGNDIVGAFVGEECRGVMSPDPNFMGIIFLTVGDDQQTGETVTFKAYLADEDRIVELNQVLVFQNQMQTGSIGSPYIFNYHELVSHTLNLIQGWSGISSYIIPSDLELESLFSEVESDLVILQNFNGFYWPAAGTNTLGSWDSQSGYQIKMEFPRQLTFTGLTQNDPVVSLNSGWNYLSVPVACNIAVDVLFAPASEQLVIVKDIAGYGVYWPEKNINTIGVLNPGKAYFVLMSS